MEETIIFLKNYNESSYLGAAVFLDQFARLFVHVRVHLKFLF